MQKLWVVWETDYPDNGSVGVEAESEEAAKLAYERGGFKDGTAKLSVAHLTLALPSSKVVETTTEELAGILKVGHRAPILEADEWRPLADHVLGLMKLTRRDALEEAAQKFDEDAKTARLKANDEDAKRTKRSDPAQEWRTYAVQLERAAMDLRTLATAHQPQGVVAESVATMTRLRSHLWLGHGHTGQYGDDGEMQCAACIPYGQYDYRRASFTELFKTLDAVSIHALVKAKS